MSSVKAQIPYKVPGYATFDLMAGYSRQVGDAKVSVQLNVDNLLDKHYITSLSALPSEQASLLILASHGRLWDR